MSKYLSCALLLVLFLVSAFIPQHPWQWGDQLALGFFFCSSYAIWNMLKEFHVSLRLWLIFLCGNACLYGMKQINPYQQQSALVGTIIQAVSLHSVCLILAGTLAIKFIVKKHYKPLRQALFVISLLSSLFLIIKPLIGMHQYFILKSESMDATLLAILYPNYLSFIMSIEPLLFFLPVAAIFLTKSSMGIGCVCVATVAWFMHSKITIKRMLFLVASFIPVGLISFLFVGDKLLDSNGRINIWKASYAYWVDNVDPLIGAGISSFNHLGIIIGKINELDFEKVKWTWLHSDWLQSIFELGIIGFLLTVWVFIVCLNRSYRHSTWLFASIVTMGVACLAQMPFRYFHAGFACMFLIMAALYLPKLSNEEQ